jgi:hypothetical protein
MCDNTQKLMIILCQIIDQSLLANTDHSQETTKFQDGDTQPECRIKPDEIYCRMMAHSPELAL